MGVSGTDVAAYLPAFLEHALAERPSADLPWHREVDGTMVMADLSGFTALSERLAQLGDEGAERLTGIINSFFELMLTTASAYGGDTLTFGGDAILLLFDGPRHATRAVAASLAMLRQVDHVAAVDTGDGKVKIGMSVGAHSDTFVLAATGLEDARACLTVLGRPAEMTALAEARAERGQLAVSSTTKAQLPPGLALTATGDFWLVHESPSESGVKASLRRPPVSSGSAARLLPFLPPYARGCGEGGERRVEHSPEHRRTVIVFVDVLGVSELMARAGTEEAVRQLQVYSALLTGLVAQHQGFVVSTDIATQGLKFVLTFGTPVAHEYAPTNAARFTLGLLDGLEESGLDLRHKIGLHGGHVFAGELGPASRRQYTVMGDAVNLAARLMAAAPQGGIYASRALLDCAGPSLCARELEPIKVKGKSAPIDICILEEERLQGDVAQWQQPASVAERLFGRDAERKAICDEWDRTAGGNVRTVLVEGDPGIGKTRLVDEALAFSANKALVTRVACYEHLQSAPFTPWIDALSSIMGLSREMSTDDRTEAVSAYIEAHLPRYLELSSLLNPLLVLSLPQSDVVGSLDSAARRQRLFELVAELLAEVAGDRGHIVVVEDVHWVDESSLALVKYLGLRDIGARILLLLTARPTGLAMDVGDTEGLLIRLSELDEEESLAMVRAALAVDDLPGAVGDAIYSKTRGNPLFLEEVVRALQAPGVLTRILGASSVMQAAELATLEIPDRVQGLLMSRIDRLRTDVREVLKAGAVVGRSFDEQLLVGIEDELLQSIELGPAFAELVGAALVVRVRGEGEDGAPALSFRHALVQDVAYESLPFSRRRELHGRIATYLEATQKQLDHGLLVHHYRHAGDVEKTRLHAVRASESSVAAYANLEAIDYLTLALETADGRSTADASLRSRFEELIGDSLQTLGRHAEAVERFVTARRRWAAAPVRAASSRVLEDLSPIDDGDARDSLLCWKVSVSLQRGPAAYRRAIRWLDMGIRALPKDRTELSARVLIAKSVCLSRLAKYRESLSLSEDGLRLAREVGDAGLVGYGCTVRSLALSQLGRFGEAIEASREAIEAYALDGDLVGQALGHLNLGLAYQLSDDPRRGLEQTELALAIYVKLGDANGVVQQHHNLGAILLQLGELDEGMRHLQETVSARHRPGCPPLPVGWAYVLLAQGHLLKEQVEAAGPALAEGRAILESINASSFLLDTDIVEAQLELARGNLDEAERRCNEVIEAAHRAEAAPLEGEALRVLGQVLIAQGRPEAAVAGLQDCMRLADKTESTYARAQGLAVLAEAQAACEEVSPACEDVLNEAIRLFRKMGTRLDLAKALELRDRLAAEVVDGTDGTAASATEVEGAA